MSLSATRKTKLRKCKQCKTWFVPQYNTIQATCSVTCAILYAAAQKAKEAKVSRTRARVELREYRAKSMSLSKLKNLAQREFNRWVRLRDDGDPCICCGKYSDSDALTGGAYDAGHFRTRGAADHLRYHEDNCHLQRKVCNMGQGGRSEYRARLIAKIGLERVEALENDNTPHKWTRDELVEIRRKYLGKYRALRAEREQQ